MKLRHLEMTAFGPFYEKTVIEFGPGSGHNAVYTASLKPSTYLLVDGNPTGVSETQENLKDAPVENLRVTHSLFDKFQHDDRFDFVWAEGCLPHQLNSFPLLHHISSFTDCGGCLVLSTIDSISYLSETLRRLVKFFLCEKEEFQKDFSLNDCIHLQKVL